MFQHKWLLPLNGCQAATGIAILFVAIGLFFCPYAFAIKCHQQPWNVSSPVAIDASQYSSIEVECSPGIDRCFYTHCAIPCGSQAILGCGDTVECEDFFSKIELRCSGKKKCQDCSGDLCNGGKEPNNWNWIDEENGESAHGAWESCSRNNGSSCMQMINSELAKHSRSENLEYLLICYPAALAESSGKEGITGLKSSRRYQLSEQFPNLCERCIESGSCSETENIIWRGIKLGKRTDLSQNMASINEFMEKLACAKLNNTHINLSENSGAFLDDDNDSMGKAAIDLIASIHLMEDGGKIVWYLTEKQTKKSTTITSPPKTTTMSEEEHSRLEKCRSEVRQLFKAAGWEIHWIDASQKSCTNCWAISSAAALTDRACISEVEVRGRSSQPRTGNFLKRGASDRDIAECTYGRSHACRFGSPGLAWVYLYQNGTVNEKCKSNPHENPRSGWRENCFTSCDAKTEDNGSLDWLYWDNRQMDQNSYHEPVTMEKWANIKAVSGSLFKTSSYRIFYTGEDNTTGVDSNEPGNGRNDSRDCWEQIMIDEIRTRGSIVVGFQLHSDFIGHTPRTIYKKGPSAHKLYGHAVRVIGYGQLRCPNQTHKYWLCADSYGTGRHDRGIFRFIRGIDECGIESDEVAWGNVHFPFDGSTKNDARRSGKSGGGEGQTGA